MLQWLMNSGGAGSLEVCKSKIILNFNFRISEYFGVLYCLFANYLNLPWWQSTSVIHYYSTFFHFTHYFHLTFNSLPHSKYWPNCEAEATRVRSDNPRHIAQLHFLQQRSSSLMTCCLVLALFVFPLSKHIYQWFAHISFFQ